MRTFLDAGALSVLSVPVPLVSGVSAAMNVYSRQPGPFTEEDRQVAKEFAGYAGVAVSNMQHIENMRSLAENLQKAMDSRAVIEQAKGVLVERFKVTPEEAFKLLAAVSMRTNRKLRDVADHLIHAGELPI